MSREAFILINNRSKESISIPVLAGGVKQVGKVVLAALALGAERRSYGTPVLASTDVPSTRTSGDRSLILKRSIPWLPEVLKYSGPLCEKPTICKGTGNGKTGAGLEGLLPSYISITLNNKKNAMCPLIQLLCLLWVRLCSLNNNAVKPVKTNVLTI